MKYGPANSNWKGGTRSNWMGAGERAFWQAAQAKNLLKRILTTHCDARGELPGFTRDEQQWAMRVCRERPDWAEDTLKSLGFPPKSAE